MEKGILEIFGQLFFEGAVEVNKEGAAHDEKDKEVGGKEFPADREAH
jgi:hypothetical protein